MSWWICVVVEEYVLIVRDVGDYVMLLLTSCSCCCKWWYVVVDAEDEDTAVCWRVNNIYCRDKRL